MAENDENAQLFLERTSRTTRGKRMTKLLDEELEADEEFWGQDAFKEVAEDVEYEAEDEIVDEFDSDFDEDEANAEEAAPEDEVERVKRKRLLPPGSKPSKKDKKKVTMPKTKGIDDIEAAVAAAVHTKDEEPTPVQLHSKPTQEGAELVESPTDLEGEKIVRKSTRTAVVVRQAEREALRAAMQATTIKPVKKRREGERRITQEDMLLEAAQTEILNQQHLERMLAHEEEVKQKAIVHKKVYDGPRIRFYSRDGENFLEFIGPVSEPEQLFGQPRQSCKRSQTCAVTGLPAKYLDPLTGLPYATIEAFKVIRKRLIQDDITQRKRTPGRNLRSPRPVAGRSTVQKARRPSLPSFPGGVLGKLSSMEARSVSHKSGIHEEAQQVYVPETSPTHDTGIDLTTRPMLPGHPPHQLNLIHATTLALSESSQGMESAENHLPSVYANSQTSRLETQSGPLWVDIPPPKEGPSEEDYLLDDLTSLEFGPILASQHDVTRQAQREHELDIVDPASEGTFLLLDVLSMPPDFGSSIVLR